MTLIVCLASTHEPRNRPREGNYYVADVVNSFNMDGMITWNDSF